MDYVHSKPVSLRARMAETGLFFMKINKRLKGFLENNAIKRPARIPGSLKKNCKLEIQEQAGRKVWIVSPHNAKDSEWNILYLHGGAYVFNITYFHWKWIEQLCLETGARIIVPDYPLAPEYDCKAVFGFLDGMYADIMQGMKGKWIFMGDSAGGGMSLGLAMHFRDQNRPQPRHIILLSPWMDVNMDHPAITALETKDKMLDRASIKEAGKWYANDWDTSHHLVSPIFGTFEDLGSISLFIGGHDLLYPDCQKYHGMMKKQGIPINYFYYPELFHVWMAATFIPESRDVLQQIKDILNQ